MKDKNNIAKDLQKIANNPVSDEDDRFSIVLKVIYGSDKLGNLFIYIKLKNFKSENEENMFLSKSYILMYQNPKGKYPDEIKGRQDLIIEIFKSIFSTSEEREFDDKKSFFIKGKLFREIEKIDKFYFNLVKRLISTIGADNVHPSTIQRDYDEMINSPAPLNFFKKIIFSKDKVSDENSEQINDSKINDGENNEESEE